MKEVLLGTLFHKGRMDFYVRTLYLLRALLEILPL